jgi:hypothetical protein
VIARLADLARDPGAEPLDLLLAVDAGFGLEPPPAALDRLEALAAAVAPAAALAPADQARALAEALAVRACFRRVSCPRPEHLFLAAALADGRAHPHLLATIYAHVARCAGLPWFVAARAGQLVLVHADAARQVRPARAPEVALAVLDALVEAFRAAGDLGGAVRAASLRRALAVAERRR